MTWWVDWRKALIVAAIAYLPLAVLFTFAQIVGERVGDALVGLFRRRPVPPAPPTTYLKRP